MLHIRYVIAHKTLFSPSFRRENTVIGMPHFRGENSTEFRVWCAMAYQKGFALVFTVHANVLLLGQSGAP